MSKSGLGIGNTMGPTRGWPRRFPQSSAGLHEPGPEGRKCDTVCEFRPGGCRCARFSCGGGRTNVGPPFFTPGLPKSQILTTQCRQMGLGGQIFVTKCRRNGLADVVLTLRLAVGVWGF